MKASLYVYELAPIDYWPGWTPLARFVKEAPLEEVMPALSFLLEVASRVPMIGLRGGKENPDIFIGGLPPFESGDCSTTAMVGWKLDNNGTTFIASRIPLPWLEENRIYPKVPSR